MCYAHWELQSSQKSFQVFNVQQAFNALLGFLIRCQRFFSVDDRLIIDHVALAKQGDNALGSIRLSVRPSVCLFTLSYLNIMLY